MTKPTIYSTFPMPARRRAGVAADVNANFMTTGTLLNTPTLYPSAYLVLTSKGYTNVTEVESRASSLALPRCSNVTERKHYYAGADRVAASLGGGGLKATGSNSEMQERANGLFWESHERVNGRMLQENDHECIWQSSLFTQEYYESIKDIPGRMNASVEFYLNDLYDNLKMLAEEQHQEKDVYFYHSDHLGSASWITDGNGIPVQHLQYLPFGEPFVDQHPAGYQERFRFTGKERDEETGYGYFGARYMDHELTAMWLSVDPMADKYPSISPYAYCAWNPVKLVDPDGAQIWITGSDGNNYQYKEGKLYNKDGSAYEGNDEFALRVMNDLNTLKGNGMEDKISSLEKSDYKHRIESTDGHNQTTPEDDVKASNGTGCKTTIEYNPDRLKEDGWKRPAVVGLAHELQHSFDMDNGIYNKEKVFYDVLTICSVLAPGAEFNKELGIYTRMETRQVEKGEYNAVITANLLNRNLCGGNAKPRTKIHGCPISKLRP